MKTMIYRFYILIVVLILLQPAYAQLYELKGDTIFVNTETSVQVKFPTDNIEASFADKNAPYSFSNGGRNSLLLDAKAETSKCGILRVNEGKRNHSFYICYKKNINPDVIAEVQYDFSTTRKLQDRLKILETRESTKAVAVATTTPEPTLPVAITLSPAEIKAKSLMDEADKLLKRGDYNEAEKKYYEVLNLMPENYQAKLALAEISEKKNEKERLVKKEQNEKLLAIRTKATNHFYAKQYNEAINGYKELLQLSPNDSYAQNQLTIIEKVKSEEALKEKQEQEKLERKEFDEKVNRLKATAGKAFNEKKYDEALTAYNAILAIEPKNIAAIEKIESINKIKAQLLVKEKEETENKNKENIFAAMVKSADKAMNDNEPEVAKAGYLAAKEIKPNDASLDKKIAAVTIKLQEKDKQQEYQAAIIKANEAKGNGDYETAKIEFLKAAKLDKEKTYPADQLKEIENILSGISAKTKAEKEKAEKEKQDNIQYALILKKGTQAFEINDFVNARTFFAQAIKIKPDDSYPAEKLSEIDIMIQKVELEKKGIAEKERLIAELNKKYTTALAKGNAAYDLKEYEEAKEAYSIALQLKPGEQEPISKLRLIENKLAEGSTTKIYEDALGKANIAMGDNNYREALQYYRQAQRLKPLEQFIVNQIRFLQNKIAVDSMAQAEVNKKEEEKAIYEVNLKRFKEGMQNYEKFEQAATVANYENQLYYAKQYLNILPDDAIFNARQYNQSSDWVKNKIKQIRDYLTRTKGQHYQGEAIPYLILELEKKYDNINFNAPPDEQELAANFKNYIRENSDTVVQIVKHPNTLNISDSANKIKISCNAIVKMGDMAYFKILVRNNSDKEFLTGPMLLTENKKDKSVVKHLPVSISAFPIVLPGKEYYIIYETPVFSLKDNSKLFFSLKDRGLKNDLKLAIPVVAYNTDKAD